MDAAVLPIGLLVVGAIAAVVLVEGLVRRATLQRTIARTRSDVPRDPATGLLDRSACLPRLATELKRAGRGGGSVWVAVITVVDGDPDRFGRLLYDSVRVPEVAFRLAERVVCVARPDLGAQHRAELLGRIVAAGPREQLTIGEAVWRADAGMGDASDLLRAASTAMGQDLPASIRQDATRPEAHA